MRDARWRAGAVVLSGMLMGFCFPPLELWPLILPTMLLLLVSVVRTSPRAAFYLGLLHGLIGYGGTLYWLYFIFGSGVIALLGLLALFTALFCFAFNVFVRRTDGVWLPMVGAASLWTAIEFFRCELFLLRFPWITPGTALGPTWLSPIVGVYGGSFLVALAAAGFLWKRTIAFGGLCTAAILLLGLLRPAAVGVEDGEALRVTMVQSEECELAEYLELTEKAASEQPDIVLWPEYALPYDVRRHPKEMRVLQALCAKLDCLLVLGTKTFANDDEGGWYNTALAINADGPVGEYHKVRPVHFFNDGRAGTRIEPIVTDVGTIGTPVCFDCDFTAVMRRLAARGAECFLVPSYDDRAWSVTQHLQHAALYRLRAAETGRWIAVAATSGVSQVVDPHGHVHARLEPMKAGTLTRPIGKRRGNTMFTRFGWLFPWLAVADAILIVGLAVCRPQPVCSSRRSR